MIHITEEQLILPACLPALTSTRRIVFALGAMTLALAGCAKERTSADSSAAAAAGFRSRWTA